MEPVDQGLEILLHLVGRRGPKGAVGTTDDVRDLLEPSWRGVVLQGDATEVVAVEVTDELDAEMDGGRSQVFVCEGEVVEHLDIGGRDLPLGRDVGLVLVVERLDTLEIDGSRVQVRGPPGVAHERVPVERLADPIADDLDGELLIQRSRPLIVEHVTFRRGELD